MIGRSRVCFRLIIIMLFSLAFIAEPWTAPIIFGQENNNDEDEILIVPKIKNEIAQLEKELEKVKRQKKEALERVLSIASSYADSTESSQKIGRSVKSFERSEEILSSVISKSGILINAIELSTDKNEKEKLMKEAAYTINAGRLNMKALTFNMTALEDLKRRAEDAEIAIGSSDSEKMKHFSDKVFSENEMGGGVFIDETAEIPVDRKSITRAEYDVNTNRFILYEGDRRLELPPMDPALTAVAIRCIYQGRDGRDKIAVSFNIDPVNMGRIVTGIYDHETVLFGCDELIDTELGRILIDSDDLVGSIWMGNNRIGDDLTRKHSYHSLVQLSLDHPVTADIINKAPLKNRNIDMRVWIRPNRINVYRSGNRLEFKDVSFQMLTETVRLDSPSVFKGTPIANPGADVFAAFFNSNFSKFKDMVLRRDEDTGRLIRPFEELKEVAKIVGIVRWVKGAEGENPIPMNTSWANSYRTKMIETDLDLPIIGLPDIERKIQGPIVIYNQYGPSRIINEKGGMFRIKYDSDGNFTEMVRIIKGNDGQIVEVKGSAIKKVAVPKMNTIKK